MADFESCVEYVLQNEGELTQNKSDPGGITNFGISLRFLRDVSPDNLKKAGIFEDVTEQTIIELTAEQAKKLYYSEFWVHAPFDKIMNGIICQYIFDMTVQHSLVTATKLVQQACCSTQKNKNYVVNDGVFGKNTLSAVNYASFTLIPAMISERTGYMRQLVAVNPKLDVFLDGWLTRAFDIQ